MAEAFLKQQNNANIHLKIFVYILVQPFLYSEEHKILQLNISWNPAQAKDEKINVDVRPVEDNYCSGNTCFQYGVFANISDVLLPKNPDSFVEFKDCPIRPGCSYVVRVTSTTRKINSNFTYIVPDCVFNICSCSHSHTLANLSIMASMEKLNEMSVSWNITPSYILSDNIRLENISISITKHGVPSLTWGGYHEDIAYILSPIYNKTGDIILHNSKKIYLSKQLTPSSRIDISGSVIDNRGCTGETTKITIIAPNSTEVLTQRKSSKGLLWILWFIIPIGFVIILIAFVTPKIYDKLKKRHELSRWRGIYRYVSNNAMSNVPMEDNFLYVDKDILEARARGEADYFEIPHSCLHLGSEIGKGAFGRVFIARADNLGGKPGNQLVAVKKLKKRPSPMELEEFLDEISTLKKVGRHPNIVNILGCCTIQQPLLMVMEYVGCGDLLHYLRTIRAKHKERTAGANGDVKSISENHPLQNSFSNNTSNPSTVFNGVYLDIQHSLSSNTNSEASYITQPETVPAQLRPSVTETMYTMLSRDAEPVISTTSNSLEYVLDHTELHSFAKQIAKGMKHLEDKQITHRDLAARNILIDENKTLKISDFGLSRCGIYINTKRKKVPLRWLSIEAMRDNLYSSKSDVWAFGIVLWEIGTLGGFPYPTVGNHELLQFLAAGERLARPENCSKMLYEIMTHCWKENPEDRPSFTELCLKLEPQKQKIYIDFDELGPNYVFPPTSEKPK